MRDYEKNIYDTEIYITHVRFLVYKIRYLIFPQLHARDDCINSRHRAFKNFYISIHVLSLVPFSLDQSHSIAVQLLHFFRTRSMMTKTRLIMTMTMLKEQMSL